MNQFLQVIVCITMLAGSVWSRAFYIDATGGSNSFTGRTMAQAWQSVGKLQSLAFIAGDTVALKRGSEYPGNLWLTAAGTKQLPVLFTAYGTGADPVASNRGNSTYQIWAFNNSTWVVVEHIHFRGVFSSGFELRGTSSDCTIRDCEIDSAGMGINMEGTRNTANRCSIHDLHIINNTPGGDDDYGAVGVVLSGATDCEVSECTMVRCQDVSFDYGLDGGVVETWKTVRACRILYNRGEKCNGFFEAGGEAGDSVTDLTIAYNASVNNGDMTCFHNGGGNFAVGFRNIRIDNNTVFQTDTTTLWSLQIFDANPAAAGTFLFRNNIFVVPAAQRIFNFATVTHLNNLYFAASGNLPSGFSYDATELQGVNPLFVDTAAGNFHLTGGSPARDAGAVLGYSRDHDGVSVPQGLKPDMGAYEYGSSPVASHPGISAGPSCSKSNRSPSLFDLRGRKIIPSSAADRRFRGTITSAKNGEPGSIRIY